MLAVVGLNMGGPIDQAAVEPFLEALFADGDLVRLPWFLRPFQARLAKRIARKRAPEVRHNYAKIGGGSPILGHTMAQMNAVAASLKSFGREARGFVAMRYAPPFAMETARELSELKPEKIVALSLYPQFSPATGGSSLVDFRGALECVGLSPRLALEIDRWGEEDSYISAMVEMIAAELEAAGTPAPHLLFSAHGLPKQYIARGDPYEAQIRATFETLCSRLPKGVEGSLAFQSRVGPLEWLRPYTDEHLRRLSTQGVRRVTMVPLGFVSDHIETLYEMDLLYGDLARSLGMDFRRILALNAHPRMTGGLARMIHDRLR